MLSPSAANGLEACSEDEVGFTGFNAKSGMSEFSPSSAGCPERSKVGLVHIRTPLLSHELEGAVYLASPAPNGEAGRNPFKSLLALYIVAQDPVSGVLVKLAGEGHIDERTLRVATTFADTPQVPFEELKLELFGGQRASLTTPPLCGNYATQAAFTPWSGTGMVDVSSLAREFDIGSGVNGSGCSANPLAFSPGFYAQSANVQAGAFTSFQLELARPDGDQALSGLSMHLPGGIAALLSTVKLCSEAQASADACPAESQVGDSTAIAGLGTEPYVEGGGKVYITGPYGDAPFGLEIVSPAVAGPFDLGTVTVRSKLYVNPNDASIKIVSDPLPTQLRGIPLQLKRVIVNVDRPGFEFNPTNCSPLPIDGTVSGDQGASAQVSSPFQVGGCQALPFKPKLTAATKGQASKAGGDSFAVTVRSAGLGQANIAKVRLQLPKALPARLTTLQKACTEGAFNANPASCPEGSVIGQATIRTPVLRSPLTGPAYLVSHGGAAFPDVEFVLQGEGITLVLDGKTQIKNQITYSKFESAPDAVHDLRNGAAGGSAFGADGQPAGKGEVQPVLVESVDADGNRRPERRRHQTDHQDRAAGPQGQLSQAEEAHPRAEARARAQGLRQEIQTRQAQTSRLPEASAQTLRRQAGGSAQATQDRPPRWLSAANIRRLRAPAL